MRRNYLGLFLWGRIYTYFVKPTIMEYYSSLDASQLDSETPTLFELISANQLEALLSPSLRYILVHYAQRYPGYLLKVTNNFDEINLALRTSIEWYFLKYWQGSFTENFYGLKRVTQTPLSDSKYNSGRLAQLAPSMIEERRRLSTYQMWISIFEITGVAYLAEKCNYTHEVLYSKYITGQLNEKEASDPAERRKIWLKRRFVELYPYVQSTWRAGNLIATLLYLSGSSKSASLLTLLFKINFSRLSQYDYQRNEPALKTPKDHLPNRVAPPTLAENLISLATTLTRPLGKSAKFVLGTFFPLAIFTLKFLEWWNNSDFAQKVAKSQANALEGNIPTPANLGKFKETQAKPKKIYKSGSVCPLCKEQILNPAIIETGYVFCYTCIYNYLTESHKLVKKRKEEQSDSESEDEEEEKDQEEEKKEDEEEEEEKLKGEAKSVRKEDIEKGGRCPITGRRLLGCRWNSLTQEFEVDGIRRLIF